MKKCFLGTAILFIALIISSCQKEKTISYIPKSDAENTFNVAMRTEVSDLLGNIILHESDAKIIAKLILENGGNKESLTFEEISTLELNSEKKEINSNITFCDAVVAELSANPTAYPLITQITAPKTKGESIYDNLGDLDVELYIPYSENYNPDSIDDITIVYTPEDENATETEGIKISEGNSYLVPSVDDSYMQNNITIVVMPVDTTNYTVLIPDNDFKPVLNPYPVESAYTLPNGLITKNITNSATIAEEDILYTNLARIRVRNTSWAATFTNKLKLAIYRTSADYKVEDGAPTIIPNQHKVGLYKILKKDIRANKWFEVNTVFDDDWNLHEYDQELFFCSEHWLVGKKATLGGTVSLGYSNGKPSINAEISADFSFKIGGSKLRANNELTRKSILATNMSNLGSGTVNINGYNFAVRNYGGVVDVVFTMYYTDYK